MVVTALRSFDEWDQHPQRKALANTPPVVLRKIGDAPKRKLPSCGKLTQRLEGIRVLDLTRVLAGPICGRTLAGKLPSRAQNNLTQCPCHVLAHGADVLLITSPKLPSLPILDVETSRGKRTTQLDLTEESDRERLETLVKNTDVFLQAYRPGGLQDKNLGPEEVSKARPGVVYASLTAYGWEGPWKGRRGVSTRLPKRRSSLNYWA